MPDRSRIPRAIDRFNNYISNTNSYLVAENAANAIRLGILPAEVMGWTAFVGKWNPLYLKYIDGKGSRTTAITDQLHAIVAGCVQFDQTNHILDRIAASPVVTVSDMEIFNIKKGILIKTTHTRPQAALTEPLFASIQPIGGGTVSIKCHGSSGGRASIFAGADAVQYSYFVGDTPPGMADAYGLQREISTKATIHLTLSPASSGKYLYIYLRWYLVKHPSLAGPWSSMQTMLIL
ncbi:MAG: hypothetical protein GZ094_04185 [Mariniphaga sp.]|nr:hypothetical protein [Mariniphaga sp.]